MSIPTSRLSYVDCYDLLDRALNNTVGIRVKCASEEAAHRLRVRIHQARKIDRDDNSKIYELGHPMYRSSIYDGMTIVIRTIDEQVYILIKKITTDQYEVEPLGEDDGGDIGGEPSGPVEQSAGSGDRDSNQSTDDFATNVVDEQPLRRP